MSRGYILEHYQACPTFSWIESAFDSDAPRPRGPTRCDRNRRRDARNRHAQASVGYSSNMAGSRSPARVQTSTKIKLPLVNTLPTNLEPRSTGRTLSDLLQEAAFRERTPARANGFLSAVFEVREKGLTPPMPRFKISTVDSRPRP
jgi:hypothetical protein